MIVKVCGVRTPEAVEAALDEGADWIGVILAPASPRFADDAAARAVSHAVRGRAELVGVFIDPDVADCDEAAARYGLSAVQVHGMCDRALASACSVPVIPAINVATATDAFTLDWWSDGLVMLDGAPDAGGLPGGTGRRVLLEWAREVARHRPVLLAGGLGPDNVAEAVNVVRPAGVDASSGLERAPGEKDLELVRRFVRAARTAAALARVVEP